jgi:hypothetical protein
VFHYLVPNHVSTACLFYIVPGGGGDGDGNGALERKVDALTNGLRDVNIGLQDLRIAQPHQGVTTAAEWVGDLRAKNHLGHSQKLDLVLEEYRLKGWIHGGPYMRFPTDNCLETGEGGTQEFVWNILEPYATKNTCKIYKPRKDNNGFLAKPESNLTLTCYPVPGSHTKPSFGTRKPDNVFRSRPDASGAHTIVVLGDNKRRANGKFTEEEIGHVLDIARQLLMEYQKRRTLMYCFLSDGYRFQFFEVTRADQHIFSIQESIVYEGFTGWQVYKFVLPTLSLINCGIHDLFFA